MNETTAKCVGYGYHRHGIPRRTAELKPSPAAASPQGDVAMFHPPLKLRNLFVVAIAATAQIVAATATARAADPKSSLEFVPADAHVYMCVTRLGEHAAKIGKSNWWAEVQKNEDLQKAFAQIFLNKAPVDMNEDGINDVPLSPFEQMALDAASLPMLQLAGEMAAEEVFVYTDRSAVDMLALSGDLNTNAVIGQMGIGLMFATGNLDIFGGDVENIFAERLLRPVRDNLDKVKVPHVVMGFKIKDPAKAEKVLAAQVDRLREMINDFALSAPSDKILEETVDGANCYIWRFSGESVPWPMVFDLHGDIPPAVEPIFAHLRGLKGVVTLSVNKGYVLIGIAESPVWIEKLGEGDLLADSEDFAPLKKMAENSVTGITYASREARSAWYLDKPDIANIVRSIKLAIQQSEVSEPVAKEVGKALDEMSEQLSEHLPRIGSSLTIAHTSSEGLELTNFDRTEPMHWDGTKPLTILDHVGPAPLAFWAGRNKGFEDLYGTLSKISARGYELFEKYVFAAFQPDAQAEVRPFFDRMKPVVKKFDRAVRDLWLPPLEEGQSALVLNVRSLSGPWSVGAPPDSAEVAIPLPAVVFGVKDMDQLHAGIKEFRNVFNDGAQVVSETIPFSGDAVKIEEPKSREFPEGAIYWHVLPKDWQFDKRIAPNYGLGNGFAAFSFVPLDTQQHLGTSSLKLPAPLDKRESPLAAAVYVDVPRVVETVGSWMLLSSRYEYHSEKIEIEEDGVIVEESKLVPVTPDADTGNRFEAILALSKAVPSYTSATRIEGETAITHGILRIVDLPIAAESKAEPALPKMP
jgi:hypothetical protein